MRIEIVARIRPAELPADARDGPERGGDWLGDSRRVMLKYVLAM